MKKTAFTLILLVIALTTIMAVVRDMVVVEIATGTWCYFCPGAAMGADELVENHHRAAIIENHDNDPFANVYSNSRNNYYPIDGIPTSFFDGMNPHEGGNHTTSLYSSFRNKVNSRLAVPSKYTITATGSHDGLVYNIAVTVTKVENDTNTNLKLHGVLTESGIQQNWQGQTHLEFVQRLMAPNQYGTDLDFSSSSTQTVNLTFTTLSTWNSANFEFVFFLQNNVSKEILQGCKYKIQALEDIAPVSTETIDFGNVTLDEFYSLPLTIHNWWTKDMNISISVESQDYFIYPQARDDYIIPFHEDMIFDVLFMPSQLGADNATITITTDNPSYPVLTIPLTANVISTAADDQSIIPAPDKIVTTAPNPFRDFTAIKYNLNSSNQAELQIFNVKGAKIHSANISKRGNAMNTYSWNGKDDSGNLCPSGIYFCKMVVSGKTVSTTKLIRMK